MSTALVRVLAASAILKAGGVGEFIRIAAAELALKKEFKRIHRRSVEVILAAIAASPPRAEQSESFSARAKRLYESVYLNATEKLLEQHIAKVYELNKKAMTRRIQGKIKVDYVYDYSAAFRKAEPPENPRFTFSFSFVDRRAIDAILRGHFYWYGEHYDKNISEVIKRVVADSALTSGLGRVEAGQALQRALRRELALTGGGRELTVPAGWRGSFDRYFEMLAASVTTAARAASTVRAVQEADATRIIISNPMDERTCPRCAAMNGKVFTIEQASKQMDALLAARSPDDMKKAQPWYSTKKFLEIVTRKGHVSDADSARLAEAGIVLPPYHGLCRCTVDLAPDATLGEVTT